MQFQKYSQSKSVIVKQLQCGTCDVLSLEFAALLDQMGIENLDTHSQVRAWVRELAGDDLDVQDST